MMRIAQRALGLTAAARAALAQPATAYHLARGDAPLPCGAASPSSSAAKPAGS